MSETIKIKDIRGISKDLKTVVSKLGNFPIFDIGEKVISLHDNAFSSEYLTKGREYKVLDREINMGIPTIQVLIHNRGKRWYTSNKFMRAE